MPVPFIDRDWGIFPFSIQVLYWNKSWMVFLVSIPPYTITTCMHKYESLCETAQSNIPKGIHTMKIVTLYPIIFMHNNGSVTSLPLLSPFYLRKHFVTYSIIMKEKCISYQRNRPIECGRWFDLINIRYKPCTFIHCKCHNL